MSTRSVRTFRSVFGGNRREEDNACKGGSTLGKERSTRMVGGQSGSSASVLKQVGEPIALRAKRETGDSSNYSQKGRRRKIFNTQGPFSLQWKKGMEQKNLSSKGENKAEFSEAPKR